MFYSLDFVVVLVKIQNDRFVKEVMKKKENKMKFYFENTKKDIVMTREGEYNFKNSNICWFCELPFETKNKVRDYCHLTGKYRGTAHEKCNINAKQTQSNFKPFMFHNFSNYYCQLIFKTLIDRKPDGVPIM